MESSMLADAVTEQAPRTADLARVMALLGLPGDPRYIVKDHTVARGRAELLAHIAAGVVNLLGPAETSAGLAVDDRADLHWTADRDVTGERDVNGERALDLQLARLAWVQHVIARGRGPRPDLVSDAVTTTLGTLIQLIEAWRDGRTERPDPELDDALLMVRGAADHLAGVLRSRPC
jgi:hypothetical protein